MNETYAEFCLSQARTLDNSARFLARAGGSGSEKASRKAGRWWRKYQVAVGLVK